MAVVTFPDYFQKQKINCYLQNESKNKNKNSQSR